MERRERDGIDGEDWFSVDTLLSKFVSVHDLSICITAALEDIELQTSSPDEFVEGGFPAGEQKSPSTVYGTYRRIIRPE